MKIKNGNQKPIYGCGNNAVNKRRPNNTSTTPKIPGIRNNTPISFLIDFLSTVLLVPIL